MTIFKGKDEKELEEAYLVTDEEFDSIEFRLNMIEKNINNIVEPWNLIQASLSVFYSLPECIQPRYEDRFNNLMNRLHSI